MARNPYFDLKGWTLVSELLILPPLRLFAVFSDGRSENDVMKLIKSSVLPELLL